MGKFINTVFCTPNFSIITEKGIKDSLSKEDGWERVRRIYTKNEMNLISAELQYVIRSTAFITVISSFVGATVHMNKARNDFLRKNMASTFESQHFARRSLLDTMTLAGIKGGILYSWQYGLFSSAYLLTTMSIANYRNKIEIWDHMGAAALLGGISRLKYGVKGVLVAGCLGGVLGSIAGGFLMLNMWLSGVSYEEFRYWQQENYYASKAMKKE